MADMARLEQKVFKIEDDTFSIKESFDEIMRRLDNIEQKVKLMTGDQK